MIRPEQIRVGDFVVADTNIHDFAVPGTIFRIVDRTIIGCPTSALGWMIDPETGERKPPHAYPLPHDKISAAPRKVLSDIMMKQVEPLIRRRNELNKKIQLIEDRARTIINASSRDEEETIYLRKVFHFL